MPKSASKPKPQRQGESSPIEHRFIIVKFQDRLALPPYADKLELYFEKTKSPEWERIATLAPGATFRRVYRTLTPSEIDELVKKAVARTPTYKPPQFLKNYVLDLPAKSPTPHVLEVLHGWQDVERSYLAPLAVDPAVDATDDPLAQFQWYLGPAPLGINARYAWQQPGGDGENQEIIDIEQGWTLDHEDLLDSSANPRAKLISGVISDSSRFHGTNVLGVICATDNNLGCVGVAPNVPSIGVISHGGFTFNIPEAIKIAATKLSAGGVILLEVNFRIREGGPLLPAEIDPLTFDEIQLASALDLVVVEAAGNGNFLLDAYQDGFRNPSGNHIFNRNLPGERLESGALMVGSGWRPDELASAPTPWTRRLDSNYGTRVDCFAWGDSVYTLHSTPANPRRAYESNFNGTSSASAIIAGAVLCLQGMAQKRTGKRLDPDAVNQFLTDPAINTSPNNPVTDQIGVMPDLAQIGRVRLELPDPPGGIG